MGLMNEGNVGSSYGGIIGIGLLGMIREVNLGICQKR
jgi:hypothetical protein